MLESLFKLTKRQPLCLYCGATVKREIFDR